jgi:hypothetical protein
MYRIAWICTDGKKGYGDYCIPTIEMAKDIAEKMNMQYPQFHHWIERGFHPDLVWGIKSS